MIYSEWFWQKMPSVSPLDPLDFFGGGQLLGLFKAPQRGMTKNLRAPKECPCGGEGPGHHQHLEEGCF